ncbi:MAG: hypothetical protein JSW20_06000 [Nitrospiraceae bacterium]|nr:MAG: hypothetical protein JSW20_06000 [Nitrospiraceae bacterium]
MKRLTVIYYLTAMLFYTPFLMAEEQITVKPGMWQIGSSMEMKGRVMMPFQSKTECYTLEDIRNGRMPLPWLNHLKEGTGCKVFNELRTGSVISWKQECEEESSFIDEDGSMIIKRYPTLRAYGSINYTSTSFEGSLHSEMNHSGPQAVWITSVSHFKGRRISSCRK